MDRASDTDRKASLSDYLAAERTLLAWIRTGLALMGFGFVVARFGLFLQEFGVTQRLPLTEAYGASLWFGTALIGAGIFVNLFAGWHHVRLVRELERGESFYSRPSIQGVVIASFVALVGLAMGIYLVSVRNSAHPQSGNDKEKSMTFSEGKGIVDVPSNHSVAETVQRLKEILNARG